MSETTNAFDKIGSLNVVNHLFLVVVSNFIKILTNDDDAMLSLVLNIKNFKLSLILDIEIDACFNHVEFLLTVEQVVEGELRKIWAGNQEFKTGSSVHDGSHGRERCKSLIEFVGVPVVLLFEWVYIEIFLYLD